jgi:threonyl-tRNA synthetase
MAAVKILLPDKSVQTFDNPPTVMDVAQRIGPRLAKEALGAVINDDPQVVDVRTTLADGNQIKIITSSQPEALEVLRHSAAHVMAQAVQELWPDVKVTIGPVIEKGFFYDFDSPRPFTPEDLEKIEAKMKEIIARNLPVVKEVWSSQKAIEVFQKMGETYKVEIIRDLGAAEVSVYRQGEWFDLCRGPHVQTLGQIKAIKVLSLAGAYWRGDETRAQLQRIYATAFADKKELEEHLKNLEEAKKRDHRRLGKDLSLFTFHPFSPGGPFFTPNGTIIYNELQKYIREMYVRHGYQEVITPQVFDVELFKQSGHYANYLENMFFTKIDERDFAFKPMNCPGHCLLYGSERRSYRDLPWRVADFGRLHRFERSGVMHGLTRVRTFCQDDAHIFCRTDQMMGEIQSFVSMLSEVYQQLGLNDYKIYLSTRPEKRMGSDEMWDATEGALRSALENLKLDYKLNPADGAFYGPKLDVMFVDAIRRPWQLGTLQVDSNLPNAFHLEYVGEDNKEHRPVLLHRAILGSLERFIGVYLEHTAGHLPTWLAPIQMVVMNVTEKQESYAREVTDKLRAAGLRVHFDDRGEKLGFKIREAQLKKVPYMAVIGDNEMAAGEISLRLRNGENKNNLNLELCINTIRREIQERQLLSPFLQTPDKH